MALGRRCDNGCESWPDRARYSTCPACGQETFRFRNLQPLSQEEANEREFELRYADHCEALEIPVDGPLGMDEDESAEWDALYPEGRPREAEEA